MLELGWQTVALVVGAIAATIGFGQGPRFATLTTGSVAIDLRPLRSLT